MSVFSRQDHSFVSNFVQAGADSSVEYKCKQLQTNSMMDTFNLKVDITDDLRKFNVFLNQDYDENKDESRKECWEDFFSEELTTYEAIKQKTNDVFVPITLNCAFGASSNRRLEKLNIRLHVARDNKINLISSEGNVDKYQCVEKSWLRKKYEEKVNSYLVPFSGS